MDEKKKRRSMRFGRMFNKTEKEKEKERDRTSLKSKEKLTKKGHKRSASVEDDEGRVIGAKFTQLTQSDDLTRLESQSRSTLLFDDGESASQSVPSNSVMGAIVLSHQQQQRLKVQTNSSTSLCQPGAEYYEKLPPPSTGNTFPPSSLASASTLSSSSEPKHSSSVSISRGTSPVTDKRTAFKSGKTAKSSLSLSSIHSSSSSMTTSPFPSSSGAELIAALSDISHTNSTGGDGRRGKAGDEQDKKVEEDRAEKDLNEGQEAEISRTSKDGDNSDLPSNHPPVLFRMATPVNLSLSADDREETWATSPRNVERQTRDQRVLSAHRDQLQLPCDSSASERARSPSPSPDDSVKLVRRRSKTDSKLPENDGAIGLEVTFQSPESVDRGESTSIPQDLEEDASNSSIRAKSFEEAMFHPEYPVFYAMCEIHRLRDGKDPIADLLIEFYDVYHSIPQLLEYLLIREVKRTRRSFAISHLILHFSHQPTLQIGKRYLKMVVKPIIVQLCAMNRTWEVDVGKLEFDGAVDNANVSANIAALSTLSGSLLHSVFSVDMPTPLRQLLYRLNEIVANRFDDEEKRRQIVTSLYFLRLVCPAIIAPENYGLIKTSPSSQQRRGLVLLSKIAQAIANSHDFDPLKEAYMVPFNVTVKEQAQQLAAFTDRITSERPPETEDSKEGNVSPRVRHDLTRRVKEAIRLKGEMLCKHLIEEHYEEVAYCIRRNCDLDTPPVKLDHTSPPMAQSGQEKKNKRKSQLQFFRQQVSPFLPRDPVSAISSTSGSSSALSPRGSCTSDMSWSADGDDAEMAKGMSTKERSLHEQVRMMNTLLAEETAKRIQAENELERVVATNWELKLQLSTMKAEVEVLQGKMIAYEQLDKEFMCPSPRTIKQRRKSGAILQRADQLALILPTSRSSSPIPSPLRTPTESEERTSPKDDVQESNGIQETNSEDNSANQVAEDRVAGEEDSQNMESCSGDDSGD